MATRIAASAESPARIVKRVYAAIALGREVTGACVGRSAPRAPSVFGQDRRPLALAFAGESVSVDAAEEAR